MATLERLLQGHHRFEEYPSLADQTGRQAASRPLERLSVPAAHPWVESLNDPPAGIEARLLEVSRRNGLIL